MQLIDFGGIALPDRMAAYEIPASAAVSRVAVAGGRVGSYVLGTKHETRKYTASGLFLRSQTYPYDADRVIDQLRRMIGVTSTLRQKMRDGSIRCCEAILISCNAEHNNQSAASLAQPIAFGFESDEFWREETPQIRMLTNANEAFCANAGNAQCINIKIEVSSATLNPLTITNARNGYALTYGAAKAVGETLIIDSFASTVTVNGANAYGNMTIPDSQIELMKFESGWNRLQFNQLVMGVVRYHHAWI